MPAGPRLNVLRKCCNQSMFGIQPRIFFVSISYPRPEAPFRVYSAQPYRTPNSCVPTYGLTLLSLSSQAVSRLKEVARELLDGAVRPLLALALEFQRSDSDFFATGDVAMDMVEQSRFPERKVFFGRCIG